MNTGKVTSHVKYYMRLDNIMKAWDIDEHQGGMMVYCLVEALL